MHSVPISKNSREILLHTAVRIACATAFCWISYGLIFEEGVPVLKWGGPLYQPLDSMLDKPLGVLSMVFSVFVLVGIMVRLSAVFLLLELMFILDIFHRLDLAAEGFNTIVSWCWLYWLLVMCLTHVLIFGPGGYALGQLKFRRPTTPRTSKNSLN